MAEHKDQPKAESEALAFSNGIRLTIGHWLGLGFFSVLLVAFAPSLWKLREDISLGTDFRMPHDLSNDYWLFERCAGLAVEEYDTLILGDSVVWGEYVAPKETLSHYLNEKGGGQRYANLGVDGLHPLALGGLVEYYAGSIVDKNVVVQCNPLWMSSPRRDLQEDKATAFNHPRLVPQFVPRIPCYKEEISPRLGILVEQRLPFSQWTNHLQQAYYDRTDIPGWTLQHPYENPFAPLAQGLDLVDHSQRPKAIPWFKNKGMQDKNGKALKQDFPWIDLETSLQWHAFQGVVELLQRRGNRVFVVVGPFNEHLLTPDSLNRYLKMKATMGTWLIERQIPHAIPAALPSEQYGDASHPLAAGYATLAGLLLINSTFRQALGSSTHGGTVSLRQGRID